MLGKKPSTIDFSALLGPKENLEKIAHATIVEDEVNDTPVEEKTAMSARLIMSPKTKAAIKASGIGTKKKTAIVRPGNSRIDPNESIVTRAGKKFKLPTWMTQAI